jgi:hypothetical protein
MPELREAVGEARLLELGTKFRAAKQHVPTRCARSPSTLPRRRSALPHLAGGSHLVSTRLTSPQLDIVSSIFSGGCVWSS